MEFAPAVGQPGCTNISNPNTGEMPVDKMNHSLLSAERDSPRLCDELILRRVVSVGLYVLHYSSGPSQYGQKRAEPVPSSSDILHRFSHGTSFVKDLDCLSPPPHIKSNVE